MDVLKVTLISKTAAKQRMGRAGRTQPGKCFRLFPKELFEDMIQDSPPEIQRVNLQGTVLYLKELGIHDIGTFDFLDPPSDSSIAEALEQVRFCIPLCLTRTAFLSWCFRRTRKGNRSRKSHGTIPS